MLRVLTLLQTLGSWYTELQIIPGEVTQKYTAATTPSAFNEPFDYPYSYSLNTYNGFQVFFKTRLSNYSYCVQGESMKCLCQAATGIRDVWRDLRRWKNNREKTLESSWGACFSVVVPTLTPDIWLSDEESWGGAAAVWAVWAGRGGWPGEWRIEAPPARLYRAEADWERHQLVNYDRTKMKVDKQTNLEPSNTLKLRKRSV